MDVAVLVQMTVLSTFDFVLLQAVIDGVLPAKLYRLLHHVRKVAAVVAIVF
jgi:hypothetical protein